MRDRLAVWICNLVMRTVATRDYRGRFERLTKQKMRDTMEEALR